MRRVARFLPCVGLALLAAQCNPTVGNNSSAVFISISGFQHSDNTPASGAFFDVVKDSGSPTDDTLFVLVDNRVKGPAVNASFYTVDLNAYSVSYSLTNGKNEPGVDVPFPFSAAVSGSVTPGGQTQSEIVVATKEMKLEPPLRDLWFGTQRIVATLHVTVFGRDRVGNNLTASAVIPIFFGDFPG